MEAAGLLKFAETCSDWHISTLKIRLQIKESPSVSPDGNKYIFNIYSFYGPAPISRRDEGGILRV